MPVAAVSTSNGIEASSNDINDNTDNGEDNFQQVRVCATNIMMKLFLCSTEILMTLPRSREKNSFDMFDKKNVSQLNIIELF